ncbi:helix-turn-helix domain-containing protein [Granulicella tundricola]|uniref:Helix-turn-helix domain protein n=1 Tax=Granulicella tundricola (strain ATCC BAA-1859 / DSM 23138 / MP5ACTX9) TaxID=1198114 RepID=E8WWC8_GRATM|nr:helix-turn-helix domain-containing protein [Granulicella tundricola]ADW68511.1 helix-turn-helix domain protein [Granulicella tundricola MP5ACTX9]
MQTATQTDELIVWTKPQALEEAKSVFASYGPKFRTAGNEKGPVFSKGQVGVVYLSHSEEDSAIETTLAALRNAKVSSIVFYVPHQSADFAFKVGTMMGRRKGISAEWAFNFPHLRQLLKARNIRAHVRHQENHASSFDLLEARRRLGLSQTQLASALNVTVRTLQNWEVGKGTSLLAKKTGDLRDLLSRMDDYVVAPKETEWLSSPLEAFGSRTPQQLIVEGRMRDIVIEFDRLREGQPV